MNVSTGFAIVMFMAALFSHLNGEKLKKPPILVYVSLSLMTCIVLRLVPYAGSNIGTHAEHILKSIDFGNTVLHGFLCFLLFAGAIEVNSRELRKHVTVIGVLATLGVVISTGVVGGLLYVVSELLGFGIPLLYCFIFGAIIAPTDAVAVLGFMKNARLPRSVIAKFTGESLFNDGMSIVIFTSLLALIGGVEFEIMSFSLAIVVSIFGGVLLGLVTGSAYFWILYRAVRPSHEIMWTISLALTTYTSAHYLDVSGAIAVVVAGLVIGNYGIRKRFKRETRENLVSFWTLVDEILNAALCVLIGVEVLTLAVTGESVLAVLIIIPIVLIGRYVSMRGVIGLLSLTRVFTKHAASILTWGGLRGGVSIALVLALPASEVRDLLLTMTYGMVVFSLLIMGLTLPLFVSRLNLDTKK